MRINQYLLHVTSFHFTIKTYLEQRTIFKSKHYTLVFLVSRSSTVFSSVPLGFELDFRLEKKKPLRKRYTVVYKYNPIA